MERLHKQLDCIRDRENAIAFAALVLVMSYIAYNIGLMNGRLGF